MAVKRVEEFFAYQAAVEFKEEVYRLVHSSPRASGDFKYTSQLFDAVDSIESDMAEGFQRCNPGEFANFLRYSLSSLAEAQRRVRNGIGRHYFSEVDCRRALTWAVRCKDATMKLWKTQVRESERRRNMKKKCR